MIENEYSNSLIDCIEQIESIEILNNGQVKTLNKHSKGFEIVCDNLYQLFSTSRVEPAFGVSLHEETIKEMKTGDWLQINFKNQQIKNNLPFDKLLFKLDETYGFNLIRSYKNRYDGRCIYLFLEDLTDLKSLVE